MRALCRHDLHGVLRSANNERSAWSILLVRDRDSRVLVRGPRTGCPFDDRCGGVMRKTMPLAEGNRAPPASMRSRVNLLLGDRRRSVVALAGVSILSGFTEAGTLAVVAEVASSLV